MKLKLLAVLTGGISLLLVSSCATLPKGPLASGELRLLSIYVQGRENIRANLPFIVNLNFEADGEPEVRTACFYFSDDGPYCFKVKDITYGSPGVVKVEVRTKNHGSHILEGYALYIRDGKIQPTNVVAIHVHIHSQ